MRYPTLLRMGLIVLSVCQLMTSAIGTAAETPIVRGEIVELRHSSGRIAWRVVLPEECRGPFESTKNGWRVDQKWGIDHYGRMQRLAGSQVTAFADVISNGAWDPVTNAVSDGTVSSLLPPVYTSEGDVVFLAYSSNPDRMVAVRSQGNTNTWEEPVPIDADWIQGKLIADNQGNLTYVFRDINDPTPGETLSAVRYTPEDGWQEREVIARVPQFFQTVVGGADSAGNIVIAIGATSGPIYSTTYNANTETWSPLNTLTINGSLPTLAQSPSREQFAITYGITNRELLVRRFRFDTGWSPAVKVTGSERVGIFGGPTGEIPITVDHAGNITTFWETRFVILGSFPRFARYFFATYGSYIPLSGPEPPKQFLPWQEDGYTVIYDWHAYGQGPSGSALALVSRFASPGVRYYTLYHDVNMGWGTTQNPYSHSSAGRSQSRLVWRSDETALAVVDNGDGQNLTTLFFSNKAWENQRTLLPSEVDRFQFELASSGLDVVLLSMPLGNVNSTRYRAPAETLQARDSATATRPRKR